jgi:hypothetical protein
MGVGRGTSFILKKLAISVAHRIFIKTKLFAPVSRRERSSIEYLFINNEQGTVNYKPPIN